MIRWAPAAAALLALATTACGTDDGRGVEPVATANPAATFAPLVHLHAREQAFPISADRFLRNATLEWTIDGCFYEKNVAAGPAATRTTGEGAPRLEPRRLGGKAPAYRYRPSNPDCRGRRDKIFATTDHTRPYDRHDREPGAVLREGFFLDLLTTTHLGDRKLTRRDGQIQIDGLPTYFERRPATVDGRPGLQLTYWMLYGSSQTFQADGSPVSSHEGDWERVDVLVRNVGGGRYLPVEVRYHVDGGRPRVRAWEDVELASAATGTESTHPVVYTARLSHVSYPEAGSHRRRARSSYVRGQVVALDETAICTRCPRWRTWERLRDVRKESWYGFGGGWGVRAASDDSSGPLGPSPYAPVAGEPDVPLPGPPPDRGAGTPGAALTTRNPEVAFAPLINLHSDEQWLPIGAGDFLAHSVLRWSNLPACPPENVAHGYAAGAKRLGHDSLVAAHLGGTSAYMRSADAPDCDPPSRNPIVVRATDPTRPYTSTDRPPRLPIAQGFYLDLADRRQRGGTGVATRNGQDRQIDVPVYVERRAERVDGRPAVQLTYWQLFGRHEPRTAAGPASRATREGDWQRVSVLLVTKGRDRYIPVSVRYHLQNRHRDVAWTAAERTSAGRGAATHPVVYSARGSHAPLWRAGRYAIGSGAQSRIDEGSACADCPQWQTWRDVRRATVQPWYGFGGAWGEVGPTDAATGPLGPGSPRGAA